MNPEEENKSVEDFKEPFFMRLSNALNDTDVLRNIKTTIILLIALGIPILYFGFVENISFEGLWNWKLGFLAVMVVFLLALIRIDTKARAFHDEVVSNLELNKTEQAVADENDKMKNHLLGHKFVIDYNNDQQKMADEMATAKRVNTLNHIKAKYEIKGKTKSKRYNLICKELDKLKKHNIKGKYKPIEYSDIYTFSSRKYKNGAQSKKNLTYNPKSENPLTTLFGLIGKGATIGGTGAIPFIWGQETRVILIFYGSFILAIIQTILKAYLGTRTKTNKKYFPARKFKLAIMKECNAYIQKHETKEVKVEVEVDHLEKEQIKEEVKEPEKQEIKPPVTPEQIDKQIEKEQNEKVGESVCQAA